MFADIQSLQACNLLGAAVVYLFLYESSELSLEAVDMVRATPLCTLCLPNMSAKMYCDPTCKPWTSRQWAPPGFSSRRDLVEQTRAAEANKPLEAGQGLEEGRIEKVADNEVERTGSRRTALDSKGV